jgi:hypothetical protein
MMCLLSGLYNMVHAENVQKIDFSCPDVKLSKFIERIKQLANLNLMTLKNQFSEHFQTCTI